jgi:hypothetical protein
MRDGKGSDLGYLVPGTWYLVARMGTFLSCILHPVSCILIGHYVSPNLMLVYCGVEQSGSSLGS